MGRQQINDYPLSVSYQPQDPRTLGCRPAHRTVALQHWDSAAKEASPIWCLPCLPATISRRESTPPFDAAKH